MAAFSVEEITAGSSAPSGPSDGVRRLAPTGQRCLALQRPLLLPILWAAAQFWSQEARMMSRSRSDSRFGHW